jgi:Fe-S-cluster-containing hydrogenase component 2
VSVRSYPLHSLIEGSWFKLICGASYQHSTAVRSLALAYALAGADCIDVAADLAVITAAQEGIKVAAKLSKHKARNKYPWLMVSINDGEDPHFRKAQFDASQCPRDCPQPCIKVCPANAIEISSQISSSGVIDRLCYGCGRCLPICPSELIFTRSHISTPRMVVPWIEEKGIDAIEIHTQVGHYADFKRVWQDIAPKVSQLKLLAISCTEDQGVIDYLRSLYDLISPLPCPLIWQTDGRSMSGDIGKGTTHMAISFAQKVLQAKLPGYVQLAGGTNDYTVTKLNTAQMLRQPQSNNSVSGVAYGSYARSILSPILEKLEITDQQNFKTQPNLNQNQLMNQFIQLEQNSELLKQAVEIASHLVNQIKSIPDLSSSSSS